jgi:hypothetical protein
LLFVIFYRNDVLGGVMIFVFVCYEALVMFTYDSDI